MSETIKVVVRARPMNSKQIGLGCKSILNVDETNNQITIAKPQQPDNIKSFAYDSVFSDASLQSNVYAKTAYSLVQNVLQGYNGTIFAYGQTGCGKTHSMVGKLDIQQLQGIIPRSFGHILNTISQTKHRQFLIRCSFIEIYNQEVRDLLGKDVKKGLQIKQSPDKGVFIKDLSSNPAKTHEQLMEYMNLGNKNRSVGQTAMNKDSSRSHLLFMLYLQSADLSIPQQSRKYIGSKLNLVDLAGSQRINKTGAQGERLQQAKNINLSLSALGNVISALVDGKSQHIPYRDSKLTRLLQDSLGGNTKTVMIANCSPADYNFDETLSTLRYASRAKFIKNKPIINQDPKDALLKQYASQIKKLKQILQKSGKAPSQYLNNEQGLQQENIDSKIRQKQQQLADQKQQTKLLQQRLRTLQKQHLISQNVKIDSKIRDKIRQVRQSALSKTPLMIVPTTPQQFKTSLSKFDQNQGINFNPNSTTPNQGHQQQSYKKIIKSYKQQIKNLQNQLKDIQHQNNMDKQFILNDIRELSKENKLLQGIVNILLSPHELEKIKNKLQQIQKEKQINQQKDNEQKEPQNNKQTLYNFKRLQNIPNVSNCNAEESKTTTVYGYNQDKQKYVIPTFWLKTKDIILPKILSSANDNENGEQVEQNSFRKNNASNSPSIKNCDNDSENKSGVNENLINKQNNMKYQLNLNQNNNRRNPSKILSNPIQKQNNNKRNITNMGVDVRNILQQAREQNNSSYLSSAESIPQKKKIVAVQLQPIKKQQLNNSMLCAYSALGKQKQPKVLQKPKKLEKLNNYPHTKLSMFGPISQ